MLNFKLTATLLFLFSLMGNPQFVWAQGSSARGGGEINEQQMEQMLQNLAKYLATDEGRADFKEVADYDLKHPEETIEDIATHIRPILVDEPVFFKDLQRACVSEAKLADDQVTWLRDFKCDRIRMPGIPKSDSSELITSIYYLYTYQIVFHEVLVQAGLEDQLQERVQGQKPPSDYFISSRLRLKDKDWMIESLQRKCVGCEKIAPQILDMPADQAIRAFRIKLKLRKDIFIALTGPATWIRLSPIGSTFYCGAHPENVDKTTLGKTLGKYDPNGHAREITLDRQMTKFKKEKMKTEGEILESLKIKTEFPGIKSILCHEYGTDENFTLRQVLEGLEDYFEVETTLNSPSI